MKKPLAILLEIFAITFCSMIFFIASLVLLFCSPIEMKYSLLIIFASTPLVGVASYFLEKFFNGKETENEKDKTNKRERFKEEG